MAYPIYRKTAWVNDIPPSIDDANLLKMEEGIYQNSLRINDLLAICERQDGELNAIRADIASLGQRMTTAENDIAGLKGSVSTLESTKANKADVPSNNEFNAALDKKVDKNTYDTFVNTTAPNTYRKKSDSYTKGEVDTKVNGKLGNAGDTGRGNYTFTGNTTVQGQLKTNKDYINIGGHRLYLHNGDAHIYA